MTNAATPATPAGWYPDPAGSPRSRWWDGAQWTEHFYDPATGAPAQDLRAPEGVAVYTPWIWIMIFVPLLSFVGLFSIDFTSYFTSAMYSPGSSLAMIASPAYLLTTLSGIVIYGLGALFAFLDWRQLRALGIPRPFHFAWVFLGSEVYVIGRSVVVQRRTGRGIAPMWVQIAVLVLTFIISIIWMVSIFSAMMQLLPSIQQLSSY